MGEPNCSGSLSSRNTFFGCGKQNTFSSNEELPSYSNPNSGRCPDPSAFLPQIPNINWKKRNQVPVIEDYILPEQSRKLSSPDRRLMRDKSNKTITRERMTREELIELAKSKGY